VDRSQHWSGCFEEEKNILLLLGTEFLIIQLVAYSLLIYCHKVCYRINTNNLIVMLYVLEARNLNSVCTACLVRDFLVSFTANKSRIITIIFFLCLPARRVERCFIVYKKKISPTYFIILN
jgi:hypothetical protein